MKKILFLKGKSQYDSLLNKIEYYLSHEKRMEIAQNGYRKVMIYHTFEHRIEQIMDTIHYNMT